MSAQQARLLRRELADQQLSQRNARPKSMRELIETEEEAKARRATIAAHAHDAVIAAQRLRNAHKAADTLQKEMQISSPRSAAISPRNAVVTPTGRYSDKFTRTRALMAPVAQCDSRTPRPPSSRLGDQRQTRRLHENSASMTPRYSSLEAVAALALHRSQWVQTPAARMVVERAAAEVLQPSLHRRVGQAVGSGRRAARALARAQWACREFPALHPERDLHLKKEEIFLNPRVAPQPASATARVASMWHDSSLHHARVKEDCARLARWRSEKRAWLRSSGLRRKVLIEEEVRAAMLQRMQRQDLEALEERMVLMVTEDDAAHAIQMGWRDFKFRRLMAGTPENEHAQSTFPRLAETASAVESQACTASGRLGSVRVRVRINPNLASDDLAWPTCASSDTTIGVHLHELVDANHITLTPVRSGADHSYTSQLNVQAAMSDGTNVDTPRTFTDILQELHSSLNTVMRPFSAVPAHDSHLVQGLPSACTESQGGHLMYPSQSSRASRQQAEAA